MAISITKQGNGTDPLAAAKIQGNQIQSQINAQPRYSPGRTNAGNAPTLRNGDFSLGFTPTSVTLTQGAAKGKFQLTIPRDVALYQGVQEGTVAPTVVDNFPNEGNFGWYVNTTGPTYYWTANYGGALITPTLSTFAGTITFAQHGDLSAGVGTAHSFAQISGAITATQHGNFTAASANDNLHAEATAARYGFLSPSKWSLLNNATDQPDGSTSTLLLCGTDGSLSGRTALRIWGGSSFQTVVSTRKTGWTSPTGTPARTAYGVYPATTLTTPPTQAELQAISDGVHNVSSRLAGLIIDLTAHGLIGA